MPVALKTLEISGLDGVITISDNVSEAVPPVLTALMVTAKVPLAEGVPEISPVDESKPRPVGRPPAPKLAGLLLATIW